MTMIIPYRYRFHGDLTLATAGFEATALNRVRSGGENKGYELPVFKGDKVSPQTLVQVLNKLELKLNTHTYTHISLKFHSQTH